MPLLANTEGDRRQNGSTSSAPARSKTCSRGCRPRRGWPRFRWTVGPALAETDLVRHLRELSAKERRRRPASVCFLGGGAYDSLRAEPDQPPDLARRVLHGLHAVPAGGEPGHPAVDLRIPDHDRRADRPWTWPTPRSTNGASSLAEAALMARAVTGRGEIVLAAGRETRAIATSRISS